VGQVDGQVRVRADECRMSLRKTRIRLPVMQSISSPRAYTSDHVCIEHESENIAKNRLANNVLLGYMFRKSYAFVESRIAMLTDDRVDGD